MPVWQVGRSRTLHAGDGLTLESVEVALPDGASVDHYVIRVPFVVATVVVRERERILMLRRHRFITDRWTWDVPAGKVAPGEDAVGAAARAAVDETGWRPEGTQLLGYYYAAPGISDQRFAVCTATGAQRVGEPGPNDAERVEWLPVAQVSELALAGELDGPSLTAVLWALES